MVWLNCVRLKSNHQIISSRVLSRTPCALQTFFNGRILGASACAGASTASRDLLGAAMTAIKDPVSRRWLDQASRVCNTSAAARCSPGKKLLACRASTCAQEAHKGDNPKVPK